MASNLHVSNIFAVEGRWVAITGAGNYTETFYLTLKPIPNATE